MIAADRMNDDCCFDDWRCWAWAIDDDTAQTDRVKHGWLRLCGQLFSSCFSFIVIVSCLRNITYCGPLFAKCKVPVKWSSACSIRGIVCIDPITSGIWNSSVGVDGLLVYIDDVVEWVRENDVKALNTLEKTTNIITISAIPILLEESVQGGTLCVCSKQVLKGDPTIWISWIKVIWEEHRVWWMDCVVSSEHIWWP